jgi:hypothetical protein
MDTAPGKHLVPAHRGVATETDPSAPRSGTHHALLNEPPRNTRTTPGVAMTVLSEAARFHNLVAVAESRGISVDDRLAVTAQARTLWLGLASTPCDRHELTGCGACWPMPHTSEAVMPAARSASTQTRDRDGRTDGFTLPIVDSPSTVVHMTGWDRTPTRGVYQ